MWQRDIVLNVQHIINHHIMQRIILFVISILTLQIAVAGPAVSWSRTTCDMGAFAEADGPRTATFVLHNTGDDTLAITGARANCGCTTPRYDKGLVAPGDSAVVQATYDPAGRPGRFTKYIYIDTNGTPSRSKLAITGVVVGEPQSLQARYPHPMGPVRAMHNAALLGKVQKGHVKEVFEQACNATLDTLRLSVLSAPRWLEVKPQPAVVAPGEQFALSCFVRGSGTPLYDLVTDTIRVRVASAAIDTVLALPAVVTVEEDFGTLDNKALAKAPVAVLDPAPGGAALVVDSDTRTARITLSNTGRSPLHIRRAYSATRGVNVTADSTTVKPGKGMVITVTLEPGVKAAVLRVITDDPLSPVQSLRIAARQ